ncbi:MAG: UTP--glucose-1-phosphate uridylyltransferase [Bacteriovoracaceae bacterium]|jgi:UTP--glucose-1-phosphate uridylyltransferase
MKIKKAVIPVAGKGTRFLPVTKEIPKEMIPILNKPMISLVVEEAIASGITEIIFVTARGKESIADYFDRNQALENFLELADKKTQANEVREIGEKVEIFTVRQKEQLGLGHAIKCAESLVGDEPFVVLLGDDLMENSYPATKQLIDVHEQKKGSAVIGLIRVPQEETSKYGIIDGIDLGDDLYELKSMVEKPNPADAPSDLAVPGRYVFTPEIFKYLDKIEKGKGGEYQLTDAIRLMAEEKKVFGKTMIGQRFDTGSMEGYLEATVAFSMRDKNLKEALLNAVEKYK